MAQKIEKPKPQREEAEDLEILHPERTFTVAGEEITVREYGFVEGLRLRSQAAPLLDSLCQIMTGDGLSLEQVLDILAEHHQVTLALLAQAIDRDVAWLERDSVSQEDGHALLMTWWSVNGPFLLRSVQRRRMAEMVAERVKRNPDAFAGATSTAPSSPMGTTRTASAATPSDS